MNTVLVLKMVLPLFFVFIFVNGVLASEFGYNNRDTSYRMPYLDEDNVWTGNNIFTQNTTLIEASLMSINRSINISSSAGATTIFLNGDGVSTFDNDIEINGNGVEQWLYNFSLATFEMWNSTWDNRGLIGGGSNYTQLTFNTYNSSWDQRGFQPFWYNQTLGYNYTQIVFDTYNSTWDNSNAAGSNQTKIHSDLFVNVTGDTITGDLNFGGDGAKIAEGGTGLVIYGDGESGVIWAYSEEVYLGDGDDALHLRGDIDSVDSIDPSANNTAPLGTSALYWGSAYIDDIYANVIHSTDLRLLGTGNPSSIAMAGSDGVVDGFVYASGTIIGFLDDDGNWGYQMDTDTDHAWLVNNVERMNLGSTGNLQIDGNLSISGGNITGANGEMISIGGFADNYITFMVGDDDMRLYDGGGDARWVSSTGVFYIADAIKVTGTSNYIGTAAGDKLYVGDNDCTGDCDFLVTDGSMCVGTDGCTQSSTSGDADFEGRLKIFGRDADQADYLVLNVSGDHPHIFARGSDLKLFAEGGDVFIGASGDAVDLEIEDGALCVGDGGCSGSTDGALYIDEHFHGEGANIGWVVASGANTACDTTCAGASGSPACVFGVETHTITNLNDCADASSDVCVCTD